MKSYKQEHELMRRRMFCDAWAATVNASDCKHADTATRYATAALKAFDDRFKPLADDEVINE